eukprot:4348157-Ditylum_brightwellii.AAC.1
MQSLIHHNTKQNNTIPLVQTVYSIHIPCGYKHIMHTSWILSHFYCSTNVHGKSCLEEFNWVEKGGGGSTGQATRDE